MTKRRFTYTVLRYVHDVVTGEFVNVGLVAYFPPQAGEPPVLRTATRRTIGRMRDMFPDLRRSDFLTAMSAVDRAGRRLAAEVEKDLLGLTKETDATSFARKIVANDDSSLQWSRIAGGVSDSVEQTFERLFQRHVAKYDDRALSRRSDEEVWRPVRQLLQERSIPVELEEKTITGDGDQIHFQHAWKNGVWHAYEPLSLDLADAEGIRKKAHRWLGQLTSVVPNANEPFRANFIVGAPANGELMPAYRQALKILRKSPGDVEIYEESEVANLVDQIEDEVRAHSRA
jgi:hypothetical protein